MKKIFPNSLRRTSFNKRVIDILDEELTPRMASVTGTEPEEVIALGAAYVHAACMLMQGLDMDEELFKCMLLDTVDYVWEMADGITSESIH